MLDTPTSYDDRHFIAHIRKSDKKCQTVTEHLLETAKIAELFALKVGLPKAGHLSGLLHDFGKFSIDFRNYIKSATEQLNPDIDNDWVDAKTKKGKIDHSTAGAQWIYNTLKTLNESENFGKKEELCAQILALCIVSHHSGLIDCINFDGKNTFNKRIRKEDKETHYSECVHNADPLIIENAKVLCNRDLVDEMWTLVQPIICSQTISEKVKEFYLGVITRFLFSTLIDADRINSVEFENPEQKTLRNSNSPNWSIPVNRLEKHLQFMVNLSAKNTTPIGHIRHDISQQCKNRACNDKPGIYTLSVPTGGGKTLASLRYALHHAKKYNLKRIFYITPYTSIIEQNAQVIREVIEANTDTQAWILEHHSSLEPEKQTWQSKIFSENWNCPIVFTTMVQFLETCFSNGTRNARRFHQLAHSVLIFDEIQTLPLKCVYMFCNTLNFLSMYAKTTAVLCTATQPILNDVPRPEYGQLHLQPEHELAGNQETLNQLFENLKRVEVKNFCNMHGWELRRLCDFVIEQFHITQNVLVIVNTKEWAQKLYLSCQESGIPKNALFHLSTNQCAAHRKVILDGTFGIKRRLKHQQPVLCISTQLIESGVDISFSTVVRFLAGLDSIAQAAGRCNRHNELKDTNGNPIKGKVYVVQPDKENTNFLPDIEEGKKATKRVFSDIQSGYLPENITAPEAIKQYFKYFFSERQNEMVYPLKKNKERSLLNLLSDNQGNIFAKKNNWRKQARKAPLLMQSFMEAGKEFKVIDAPTQSVIVQIGRGRRLVAELCRLDPSYPTFWTILHQTQKFSVTVFPNVWEQLVQAQAVQNIQNTEIYFLHESHYDRSFGLSISDTGFSGFLGV